MRNFPVVVVQPDGTRIGCFASGDEFFNWLHDANGYTIIQDRDTGFYTYAVISNEQLVASPYIVGGVAPEALGIPKGALPSPEQQRYRYQRLNALSRIQMEPSVMAPTIGNLNNIIIFIRFSDETEFERQSSIYNSMFNSIASGTNSMRTYFSEVSYNQLAISSFFYPTPTSGMIISYRDTQRRAYYGPYNAVTNPIGYKDSTESKAREHALLANAVNAISYQVPASLNLDGDADGKVDNVCFIIKGKPDGWSDLLWPHKWYLTSQDVYINQKKVYVYNFQLEESLDSSGVGVLCHEMFHSLGAPDLYHYKKDGLAPVHVWDLMESDQNPPQHMCAHMKMRYGKWISSIPVISKSGTYSLNPLTSSTNNAFRINSPNSTTEYFVVEYRKKTSIFESSLPGEGLLVFRINSSQDGKGNRDGPPDEVYVYRPGGTISANGTPASAHFSSEVGRTEISDSTNPSSFLSTGTAGGLKISGIGTAGNTISFTVTIGGAAAPTAQILSLYPVSNATAGGTARLWAQVKNSGTVAMPSNAVVWFWVNGPGWSGSNWVGSVSIQGLSPGSTAWYSFDWSIPRGALAGTYTYWAQAFIDGTAISDWRSQDFTVNIGGVPAAKILSLYPVNNAMAGGTAKLWAQVKNVGAVTMPSDAVVWFWVSGPGWSGSNWVGCALIRDLTPGSLSWYLLDWSIPGGTAPGTYTYWAIASVDGVAVSEWSVGQVFTIGGRSDGGFDETFDGSSAPDWIPTYGTWSLGSGYYHGRTAGSGWGGAYYNQTFSNFTYEIKIWRGNDMPNAASAIVVRADPARLDSEMNWDSYYAFQITRDGSYNVWGRVNGISLPLQPWSPSSAIHTGDAWNVLKVWISGTQMRFYINGTQVWSGTSATLTSGKVGFKYYADAGADLWVDYARLAVLASAAPAPGN